jgi:hypothetical protein
MSMHACSFKDHVSTYTDEVRELGAITDNHFNFDQHVESVVFRQYCQLQISAYG